MLSPSKSVMRPPFRFPRFVKTRAPEVLRLAGKSQSIPLVLVLLLAALAPISLVTAYAQTALPVLADSRTGMHSFMVFDVVGNFTSQYIQSIAWRFDFGWSI